MARVSKASQGAKLADVRREKGLTQTQLAGAAGITHFYVSKLETGAVPLSDSALVKLSRGLGMGIDDLATRLGRRSSSNGKAA